LGAHDFLMKPIDAGEAANTVRRVSGILDAQCNAANLRAEREAAVSTISPKEMLVLRKLLAGKRNKTVAFELGVSERTVEVHRSRLIERVGADNFAGLITFAVKAGIEPDG
ncbi:MAG: response regulator transcription factor, partial [Hyphomicrobiaceae bacterium]